MPGVFRAAAWAVYLAVSWTWCIALFLPVVLMADAGPGAWLVLFLCNVGGAAAVPFVVGTARDSVAFVRRNRTACQIFSVVTMLGQAWFMGWVASRLPGPITALGLGGVAALLLAGRSSRRWQRAALAVWLLTVAVFAAYLLASPGAHLAAVLADELAWHPQALYAVPLVFAGFVLSPYLDLTFHHAMRAGPVVRWSFAAGFPVLFGTMLLFSLAYRDELAPLMLHPTAAAPPAILQAVLAALVLQAGFTLVLHARHLPVSAKRGDPRSATLLCGAVLAAFLVPLTLGDLPLPTGQALNEFAYRCMIGFYGVLAPCWVWAAAFGPARPHPAAIVLTVTALLLAAVPMLLSRDWLPLYPVALALMAATRLTWNRNTGPADSRRATG